MSILPTAKVDDTPGLLGPKYDYADSLYLPAQLGAVRGDSLSNVFGSVNAAAYYLDMVGFGEASNPFSRSLPANKRPRPVGINYFLKTGLKCSNGADMYHYVNGIPDGSALGKKIQNALRSSGLPQLRGFAPGILEDAKDALNPKPLLNAMLGSGYPKCKKVTLPVGGVVAGFNELQIKDPVTKDVWIPGKIEYMNGNPFQTRWVQDTNAKDEPIYLSYDEWNSAPKDFCPDGTDKNDHPGGDCSKPVSKKKEGFLGEISYSSNPEGVVLATLLVGLACITVAKCKL
jgi:hypothetical protein